MYLSVLCTKCKKLIGRESYRKYTNDENDITYHWHFPECWEQTRLDVEKEYIWAIFKASQPIRSLK